MISDAKISGQCSRHATIWKVTCVQETRFTGRERELEDQRKHEVSQLRTSLTTPACSCQSRSR